MTPETLRARRAALGMSQQALHDALCDAMETPRKDYGRQVVSQWENGKRPVPHWMGVLLNNIEEAHNART
jgi:transcriptional regulator with XRE-family HTH domain